jgi:8-oxo-dGTP pyrophosphatase MutT (NUDIX family)
VDDTGSPRRASRIIVLDDSGRVLLLGCVDPRDTRTFWVTPGGGAEAREDEYATAQRELFEETGLIVSREALGSPVGRACGRSETHDGTVYEARETFFAVRVERFTPVHEGFTALEREVVVDARWWSADELDTAEDIVYPAGLGDLVRRLANGDYPTEPIDLPWT